MTGTKKPHCLAVQPPHFSLVAAMSAGTRFFDHEAGRIANVENPFAAKVYLCFRYIPLPM